MDKKTWKNTWLSQSLKSTKLFSIRDVLSFFNAGSFYKGLSHFHILFQYKIIQYSFIYLFLTLALWYSPIKEKSLIVLSIAELPVS